jgi:hypothetical protein
MSDAYLLWDNLKLSLDRSCIALKAMTWEFLQRKKNSSTTPWIQRVLVVEQEMKRCKSCPNRSMARNKCRIDSWLISGSSLSTGYHFSIVTRQHSPNQKKGAAVTKSRPWAGLRVMSSLERRKGAQGQVNSCWKVRNAAIEREPGSSD